MQTVAELPEFIRRVEKLLGESERRSLITHLAEFPKSGVLIRGTGALESYVGPGKVVGKVVEFESYTIFMMNEFLCIYSQYLGRENSPTSLKPNETNWLVWSN
jgi:hypothetical protein